MIALTSQPILSIVRNLHRLLLRLERPNRNHWPENLVRKHLTLDIWVQNHCRLHECPLLALPIPSNQILQPFSPSIIEETHHALELLFICQWAEGCFFEGGVAHFLVGILESGLDDVLQERSV